MEAMIFTDAFADVSFEHAEGRKLEVLRGVVLCGNRSLNGYDIPESAFGGEAKAKSLYDGVHVYIDHDPERGPSRRVEELAGVVTNVRMERGKPKGDIVLGSGNAADVHRNLVTFSKTVQASGASLRQVGLSHVARYSMDYRKTRVESVDEVFSVDVVIRPATTKSFSESTHTVPEKAPEDFLATLGVDLHGFGSAPLDYAFNERALFDPTYNPNDETGFDAVEALTALDGHTAEGAKALENLTFV